MKRVLPLKSTHPVPLTHIEQLGQSKLKGILGKFEPSPKKLLASDIRQFKELVLLTGSNANHSKLAVQY